MNKNKFSIADTIRFLAGCFLVAAGFIATGIPRSISGSMIGIGAALIALSATKYLLRRVLPRPSIRRAQITD